MKKFTAISNEVNVTNRLPGTYHKCMRDLKEYGYIRYIPSYNPVLGSLIYLVKRQHEVLYPAE